MSESDELAADELRISIEMGPEHEPTDRVRAALEELTQALAEADADAFTDEVVGYAAAPLPLGGFKLGYTSAIPSYTEHSGSGKKLKSFERYDSVSKDLQ